MATGEITGEGRSGGDQDLATGEAVTATGRLVAVVLMLGGIALLGVVTATLASWLVQAVATEEGENDRLRHEIGALNERIEQLLAQGAPASPRATAAPSHDGSLSPDAPS